MHLALILEELRVRVFPLHGLLLIPQLVESRCGDLCADVMRPLPQVWAIPQSIYLCRLLSQPREG